MVWNSRLDWEQGKLHYWLDTIRALAPESSVMLVATHFDERVADLPFDEARRRATINPALSEIDDPGFSASLRCGWDDCP